MKWGWVNDWVEDFAIEIINFFVLCWSNYQYIVIQHTHPPAYVPIIFTRLYVLPEGALTPSHTLTTFCSLVACRTVLTPGMWLLWGESLIFAFFQVPKLNSLHSPTAPSCSVHKKSCASEICWTPRNTRRKVPLPRQEGSSFTQRRGSVSRSQTSDSLSVCLSMSLTLMQTGS